MLIPQDKMAHFIAGVVIFALIFALLLVVKGDKFYLPTNACAALVVVAGAGVAKEYLVDGTVDYLDIIATFGGGLFLFLYTLLLVL